MTARDQWLQSNRRLWAKHERAAALMWHWAGRRGRKAHRRAMKWGREYERTLHRMSNPPVEWPI